MRAARADLPRNESMDAAKANLGSSGSASLLECLAVFAAPIRDRAVLIDQAEIPQFLNHGIGDLPFGSRDGIAGYRHHNGRDAVLARINNTFVINIKKQYLRNAANNGVDAGFHGIVAEWLPRL